MSSKSLAVTMFSGLRVAGELQYIPGYMRPGDGKEIQARCIIPVYENTARADGAGNSISHQFRLTAWGALADICAKSLPKGKEFSAVCSPRQYKGRVFYSNMQPVNDVSGQPLMTNKVSFNIDEISFGADSRDFLTLEIAEKRRGAQWDVPGTQDHANWLARVADIKALKYVAGNTTFGYAKVLAPSNTVAAPQPNVADVNATFAGAQNAAAPINPANIPAGYVVNAQGQVVPAGTQAVATGAGGAAPLF
jgi:hypothetical protein